MITTLGCKVNQYESEAIETGLHATGWSKVRREDVPNVCIINTCAVTQKAAMQSRQAIRQVIRRFPDASIVVTGCYAQTEPEEIKKIKGIHWIIGHTDKHRVPEIILSCRLNHRPDPPIVICGDIREEQSFRDLPAPIHGNRTRPFLKIQDGCNASCAYCMVPNARGPSRSLPFERVFEKINQLRIAGYHEVVLSGIHLGCYGLDLLPEKNLLDLLKALNDARPVERIRISSIEPRELNDDIIHLIAASNMLCHHFHIPLQSGDNDILKAMHRPYTGEFFSDLIHKIHHRVPRAAIGVDVLIGFPGETEAAFQRTYELIEALPVAYLHVFPFSPRKGTRAIHLKQQVPQSVAKNRSQKLRCLSKLKKSIFYNSFINKKVEVLFEGKIAPDKHLSKGTTGNYLPVVVSTPKDLTNRLMTVEITGFHTDNELYGVISTTT